TNSPYQWADRNFNANYGGINKNVWLHVNEKLHQTLPLLSNLGTTGVYIYGSDYDIAGKSAAINPESQVRNDDAAAKTFASQVTVEEVDGRSVQTIDGGTSTVQPGQTTIVKASARVGGLNFWSWGYGSLYNIYTIVKADGTPADVVCTKT